MSDGMKLMGFGVAVIAFFAVIGWCMWSAAGGVSQWTQAIA